MSNQYATVIKRQTNKQTQDQKIRMKHQDWRKNGGNLLENSQVFKVTQVKHALIRKDQKKLNKITKLNR